MKSPRQRSWHHSSRQYTLLEYASLKQASPDGIYLSLKPGSSVQWSGVLFVRKGPYAPAILRFQIFFPADYPALPPSIIFTSDIFHPLVAPLTTYTYTTGSSTSETVSATDDKRLPPGGFSLRHGFPHWFGRTQKSAPSSGSSSRNVSGSFDGGGPRLRDAIRPPPEDLSSRGSSVLPVQRLPGASTNSTSIIEALQYIKRSFDDESALDALPLEAAGNSGAWKAWGAYRRNSNSNINTLVSNPPSKQQEEWSWDGVWEERVRKGIDASISESTLYGGGSGGLDDLIRFVDLGDDSIQDIKAEVMESVYSS